jgi:hypothetical protein
VLDSSQKLGNLNVRTTLEATDSDLRLHAGLEDRGAGLGSPGRDALDLPKDLPAEGPLFPYLSHLRAGDRATEFTQRCRQLGVTGVTLHSYRYAWA